MDSGHPPPLPGALLKQFSGHSNGQWTSLGMVHQERVSFLEGSFPSLTWSPGGLGPLGRCAFQVPLGPLGLVLKNWLTMTKMYVRKGSGR